VDHSGREIESAAAAPAGRGLLKRLGVAGFLFFLVKGLLWLVVPALVYVAC
jgi:hypothetical protein